MFKKCKIPYFVGVSGTPKYPITPSYARHVLTVHKPWKTYPNHTDWIKEFQRFIVDPNCPQSAQVYDLQLCIVTILYKHNAS